MRSAPPVNMSTHQGQRALVAAAGFAVLTVDVLAGGPVSRWEQRLLHRPAPPSSIWRGVSRLGDGRPVTALAAVATAVAVARGRPGWRPGTVVLAGGVLRSLACRWADRTRPPRAWWLVTPDGPSYPSRHTTWFALGVGALVDELPPSARPLGRLVASVLLAAVGASRVRLGVHWVSDVLGGWLFAVAWRASAARAVDRTRAKGA